MKGLIAVDLGSSTGYTADELWTHGAQVVGIDIDAPGLQYARERFGGHVSFVQADGSALPIRDHTVDVVVFNHIYEHVVDPCPRLQ